MKKIISFSLWGDNPKYCVGAIKNIELQQKLFPDWTCRFYIDETTVPYEIINQMINRSEIVYKGKGDWRSMFWRFEAAKDSDIMLSRDCDSRLGEREKIVVNEWLNSNMNFHIIRDHPYHGIPILGGLWGVKNNLLKNINELMLKWTPENRWQTDQEFLAKIIYPIVKLESLIHSDIHCFANENCRKINHIRKDGEHIGGVFDENDIPNEQHRNMLR